MLKYSTKWLWLSVALLSTSMSIPMLDAWLDALEFSAFFCVFFALVVRTYFVSVSLYLQLANRGHFNRLPGLVELHCITETAACGGLWAVGGRHRDPQGASPPSTLSVTKDSLTHLTELWHLPISLSALNTPHHAAV